jgi:GDP-4-dehydro-6-deoxy-D-mannose reductase
MYGLVEEGSQPIGEDEPLRPVNPYALSKVWQEQAARYFADVYRYPLYLTRPFNHIGPRQSWRFVCSDFAGQLARIEAGRAEPVIKVGNLSARRDFLDVRDVVAAYRLAVRLGQPGVPYNIASGQPHSIREVLEILLGHCRVEVRVVEEKERLRPVDIPLLTGDSGLLRRATGWMPRRDLKDTLADLLDYWRANVGGPRIVP